MQALTRQMKAAADTARADVGAEVDRIAARGAPPTGNAAGWARLALFFPSADVLLAELQVTHPPSHCHAGLMLSEVIIAWACCPVSCMCLATHARLSYPWSMPVWPLV